MAETGRLGAALAASCLVHVCALSVLTGFDVPIARGASGAVLLVSLRAATVGLPGRREEHWGTDEPATPISAGSEANAIASVRRLLPGMATPTRFYPNRQLDRYAVPISAPDPQKFLTGTNIPAVPFRLRLFIDEFGKVVQAEALPPFTLGEAHLRVVKEMFLATAFIPGRLGGRDVPAYLDIQIQLEDIGPLPDKPPQ